jgi:hypothetical protein
LNEISGFKEQLEKNIQSHKLEIIILHSEQSQVLIDLFLARTRKSIQTNRNALKTFDPFHEHRGKFHHSSSSALCVGFLPDKTN